MTDWTQAAPVDPLGASTTREFEADFETPAYTVSDASTTRRPDAIALDYLTAFTPGPVGVGDTADGLLARAWRVRDDGAGTVWVARAADSGDAWDAEALLFAYAGAPILELDCAFDQNAQPVAAAERATGAGGSSEVWVYHFDDVAQAFTFTSLGSGRCPRVILDAPEDVASSDVLLFHVLPGAPDALIYRQQRDRYAVVLATPLIDATGLAIEDVVKVTDSRVRVVLSHRDAGLGQYSLVALETALYPLDTDAEGLGPALGAIPGLLVDVVIATLADIEGVAPGLTPEASLLELPLLIYAADAEGVSPALALRASLLAGTLIAYVPDGEGVAPGLTPTGSLMPVIVIIAPPLDPEGVGAGLLPSASTLVVP